MKIYLRDLIANYSNELQGIVGNPEKEILYLIKYILNVNEKDYILNTYIEINDTQKKQIQQFINRRKLREPLSYILGKKEFFSIEFYITPNVLIPRPETETLVEIFIEEFKNQEIRGIEIGTGSGCIAISLLKYLPKLEMLWASDVSKEALEIAQKNAKLILSEEQLKKIDFVNSYLFQNFKTEKFRNLDFIISNPPYILKKEYQSLEPEIFYEPHIALIVEEPEVFYLEFFHDAFILLKEKGKIFLESSPILIPFQRKLLENFSFHKMEIKKDINNQDRFLIITK